MTKEVPADRETALINQILGIELEWFVTVNPQPTSECQQHLEVFKLMRGSGFETWSEETLTLYLEHLVAAQSQGRNLMREKYAKMENLMPSDNISPALYDSLKIEGDWQKEAIDKYPNIFKKEAGAGFIKYLQCELDTYSPAVLESYYKDRLRAKTEGGNLVIETYSIIAQKMGYNSLEEWSQQQE